MQRGYGRRGWCWGSAFPWLKGVVPLLPEYHNRSRVRFPATLTLSQGCSYPLDGATVPKDQTDQQHPHWVWVWVLCFSLLLLLQLLLMVFRVDSKVKGFRFPDPQGAGGGRPPVHHLFPCPLQPIPLRALSLAVCCCQKNFRLGPTVSQCLVPPSPTPLERATHMPSL